MHVAKNYALSSHAKISAFRSIPLHFMLGLILGTFDSKWNARMPFPRISRTRLAWCALNNINNWKGNQRRLIEAAYVAKTEIRIGDSRTRGARWMDAQTENPFLPIIVCVCLYDRGLNWGPLKVERASCCEHLSTFWSLLENHFTYSWPGLTHG